MAEDKGNKAAKVETEFPLLKDDSAPDVSSKVAAEATVVVAEKTEAAKPAAAPEPAAASSSAATKLGRFAEEPEATIEVPSRSLILRSRRDFLVYGVGVAAAAAGFWWMLPDETRGRILKPRGVRTLDTLDARLGLTSKGRETFMGRILTFDDDVAEALYSSNRLVPTYDKSRAERNLRNNYDGQTPDPEYIPDWTLTVAGLASGRPMTLTIADLLKFAHHEEVTRLCCVEGWSAIAWWGGLRFADFLAAYPPAPGMRWAKLESSVNLDGDGNSDPYYVSIDLDTARHPQTLLATHQHGQPLDVDHGAPLRLVAPMKLGLKNIKAITGIIYSVAEPADYWNERGYSKYDGL